MFSLSRYAPWARNFALIANKQHRYNLNHLKSGVVAVSALPYVRAFAGESDTERMGWAGWAWHGHSGVAFY